MTGFVCWMPSLRFGRILWVHPVLCNERVHAAEHILKEPDTAHQFCIKIDFAEVLDISVEHGHLQFSAIRVALRTRRISGMLRKTKLVCLPDRRYFCQKK